MYRKSNKNVIIVYELRQSRIATPGRIQRHKANTQRFTDVEDARATSKRLLRHIIVINHWMPTVYWEKAVNISNA